MTEKSASAPGGLEAVIFDLDGVVFDSEHANIVLYNHLLEKVGLGPMSPESVEVVIRESMEGSLRHLMGRGERYDQALNYWKALDPTPFIYELELFPGVHETLARLRESFRTAVATNRTKTTGQALAHFNLSGMFELVVTPIQVGAAKPDPRFMEHTLEGLGLDRRQVVYVGDSTVDEALCQASGVRLVAFRNPGLTAWAHVNGMAEIPPLLGA